MSIKWVLPGWLADPTNCLPPPTPSFSTWTNRKEGFVQPGPHQTCWRWAFTSSSTPEGEAEEEKEWDGKRGDWFTFKGTPLSSGQTTDGMQWERKPFTHPHTCSLSDNYPTGPRRQDTHKARAPNSFRQGPRHSQGLSLRHILISFFLDICLFSLALMNMISGSVSRLVRLNLWNVVRKFGGLIKIWVR